MQVFLGLSLKWIVRISLVAFYAAMGYYTVQGQNPFGWLASEHPWITITLITVTCFAFLPPFVTMKKETLGGEVILRKTTWLFVFIIVGLVVTVMYYANFPKGFKPAMNKNVLGVIASSTSGVLVAVYANPIWKTYFAPTRWAYIWGLVSMFAVAVIAFKFVKPQVQKIHMPVIRKTVVSPSPSSPSFGATTPMGATVRPEAKTGSVPSAPPETEVEETEEP